MFDCTEEDERMIIKNSSSKKQTIMIGCSIVLPPGASLRDVKVLSPLSEEVTIKEDLTEIHPRSQTSAFKDEKKENSAKQKLND
jgi:hypothetical protein